MKRWLIAMTTFVLVTAACTAGGGSERCAVRDRHGQRRLARPGDAADVGRLDRSRAPAVQQDLRRLHGEVPLDHGQQRGWRERPEDHRRDQRRQPAGHGALVHAGQRGPVLRVGRVAGPEPVHRAERLRRQPVPAVGRGVHELRREPVRVPVPDGRPRPVLQHRHVQEGGHRRPAQDALRAGGQTRRSSRSSTPTGRSRSPASFRGSATTSSAPRTWGTSSARSGTATTARRRWSTRDPAWKAMFQWQHDFIANVYGGGDFQTGVGQAAAVRRRFGGRVLDARRTSRRAGRP